MPDDPKKPRRSEKQTDEKPATFSGESLGSSPNTATGFGRDGDVIVQDDIVYGRPLSGRERAEGDRVPDQEAANRPPETQRPNETEPER